MANNKKELERARSEYSGLSRTIQECIWQLNEGCENRDYVEARMIECKRAKEIVYQWILKLEADEK